MSNNLIAKTREWYQQAAHCARQADAQTNPKVKQQFLSGSGCYWRRPTLPSLTKRQEDKPPKP
jgi:hypothetical protein